MHRSFFPNRRFFARPLDDASSPSSRIVISSRQGENRAPRRMTVHLNEPLKGGPREREPHRAEARSPSRQTNLALTAVKPFRTGSFPVHACRSSTRNTIFVKPEEFLAILTHAATGNGSPRITGCLPIGKLRRTVLTLQVADLRANGSGRGIMLESF